MHSKSETSTGAITSHEVEGTPPSRDVWDHMMNCPHTSPYLFSTWMPYELDA